VLLHLVGVSTNVPSPSSSSSCSSPANNGGYYNPPSDVFSFVRRHRPSWLTWSAGIVGVQPSAILLERLDVGSSRRGLKGLLERVERVWGWDGNSDLLGEPYWFQDNFDGLCLGPGGFSECGDATLWRLKRRPLTKRQLREKRYKIRHRQRLQNKRATSTQDERQTNEGSSTPSVCVWPFFCERDSQVSHPTRIDYDEVFGFEYEEEEEEGFALQLTGVDAITANSSFQRKAGVKDGERRHKRRLFWHSNDNQESYVLNDECLLSFAAATDGDSAVQIGSCSSEEAWVWHVNRDGILVREATKAERRRTTRRWSFSPRRASAGVAADGSSRLQSSQADFGCVHRTNSSVVTLLPCDGDGKIQADENISFVGFSLVRYPSTPSKSAPRRSLLDSDADSSFSWEPWTTLEGPSTASIIGSSSSNAEDIDPDSNSSEQHLPTSRRSSQSLASTDAKHRKVVDLKSTTSMLHTTLEKGKSKKGVATSASHIRDAPLAMNGVAFHNQRAKRDEGERKHMGPSTAKLRLNKSARGQTFIHDDSSASRGGDHVPDIIPHRPRKIPSHPYIQSSEDFVWVDPLTSLEYPTDLCEYLGHTKKEAGRHTLMGVGQYYRTAFNIKVYGVAMYVAKRDVLADPKFGEYATLSSEDLRARDDFYEHLMNMPSPGEDPANSIGGFFDRTLFIKINMQLSTETMRKSLESDWSLLTEEMKSAIIQTSFKERMADDRMRQKIQSQDNSSNCSCGQLAPPEYDANPSCCARGTELVFTWRKNGDFEIRLDGRIMDVFPRPDIAKGIFWEYLNNNPISLDAKAHFADGFPFLLAPLAQVKGMSSAVPQTHEPSVEVKSTSSHPMHRLMDVAMHSVDALNLQAHSLSKWVQDGAIELSSSAIGSAKGVARELSEELDRHRVDLFESAFALQKEGMEILSSLIKLSAEESGLSLAIINHAKTRSSPYTNGFQSDFDTAPPVLPDEIGIKIDPSMNFTHRLFFTTVHAYLLLLFVVSIPGSINTRLVAKRRILETKKFMESNLTVDLQS